MTRTPQEVFECMRQEWLGAAPPDGDLLAEDAVLEMPFAAPGHPKRIEGRDGVVAFTGAGRAAFPLRLDEVGDVTVHETADPEVIVVEYTIDGRLPDGSRESAPFIGVLRVRDGRTLLWREYQDKFAIASAIERAGRKYAFAGPEWVAAMRTLAAQLPEAKTLAGVNFRISSEITGAPDGLTGWHFGVVDGVIEVGQGTDDGADLKVRTDYQRHRDLTVPIWGDDPEALADAGRKRAEAEAEGSLITEGPQPPPALQALIRALHDPVARITA
jgi:ketosteroid isomerase-like protein